MQKDINYLFFLKNYISKNTILLCMMSVLTLCSYAYDFEINGIYYNKIKTNEVAVTNSNNLYSGRITIPSTVTYDGIKYNVTRIGYQAFIYCTDLTYISIPNSITSIGEQAFFYCTKLSYISIPNSVTNIEARAFYNCNCLTSVGISNNVTNIGWEAFAYCSGLTSITIPNSVTSIGHHAFHGCSNMEYIEVEERNTKYDSRNHCNAIIVTATNELIFGCKNTIIPNSVTSIGEYAFGYCRDLTSITIPNSITNIGKSAFHGCTGLKDVYNYALVPQNLENEPFGETPKYKTLHVVKGNKYAYENSLWKETFIILDDLEPTAVKSIKKYRDINIDNWQGLKGEGQINIKNRKKYIR